MRYTKSKDGIQRASIRVIVRLDREEITAVKALLRERKQPFNDKAVREFVGNRTEYDGPSDHGEDIPREKWGLLF